MFDFDPDLFMSQYNNSQDKNSYPALSDTQLAGLRTVLGFMNSDSHATDVRWAAYMLATVKHECADRWQPIEEFGKGQNHPYGRPITVTDAQGNSYTNTYYGRGYVQITWQANYQTIDRDLGLNGALVFHPETALDPPTAYAIMSFGMRNGTFTGRKLSDYINGSTCDYFNARRIVNALDQAAAIQGYAEAFESMLQASLVAGSVPAASA